MPSIKETQSQETKQAIIRAASQLFAERGFDSVTMREIAKRAGCSHTTIYIYFKDKEALLHQLAVGPLLALKGLMTSVLDDTGLSTDERLKSVSRVFIEFCFTNRTMYSILFFTRASRVDEDQPALEVQAVRNELFGLLKQAVGACLDRGVTQEMLLAYARIFFFHLQGVLGTYLQSEEPVDLLLERLSPTFDLAVDVMVYGFKHIAERGGASL